MYKKSVVQSCCFGNLNPLHFCRSCCRSRRRRCLSWCYTERFTTTIFSSTQRWNIVSCDITLKIPIICNLANKVKFTKNWSNSRPAEKFDRTIRSRETVQCFLLCSHGTDEPAWILFQLFSPAVVLKSAHVQSVTLANPRWRLSTEMPRIQETTPLMYKNLDGHCIHSVPVNIRP